MDRSGYGIATDDSAIPPVPGETISPWSRVGSLARPCFFAGLVLIGFANGVSEKIYRSIAEAGFATAAFNTFDISIILWGALAAAIAVLLQAGDEARRRGDTAIGLLAGISFLAPVPALSWLGLGLIALYLHRTASGSAMRRAAAIIFALTIPLFWTRLAFAAFSDTILHIDARLVGWMIGTVPDGNVVPLANGSGSLFIAPGCSSLSNLSLVFVSAAIFINLRSGHWTPAAIGWTAASAAAVVAINVTRISLIGLYPWEYDLLHGPIGASVAGWLTFAVIALIGYNRIGNDAPASR
jgi:exosortase/archaeosortase family protein